MFFPEDLCLSYSFRMQQGCHSTDHGNVAYHTSTAVVLKGATVIPTCLSCSTPTMIRETSRIGPGKRADDPKIYTKPFVAVTNRFKWIPNQEDEEQFCVPSEMIDYIKIIAVPAGEEKVTGPK